MYQVYDNGDLAQIDDEDAVFHTFTEAQKYTSQWLPPFSPLPEPNTPVDYSGFGDTVEIRCSALIESVRPMEPSGND